MRRAAPLIDVDAYIIEPRELEFAFLEYVVDDPRRA
jgi:hypothetical protein